MIDRPFRWQRAADGLHAVPCHPEHLFPGDEISTLCGITTTLARADFGRRLANGAPPPTCRTCTQEWIQREHRRQARRW